MDHQQRTGLGLVMIGSGLEALLVVAVARGWKLSDGGFYLLVALFGGFVVYGAYLAFSNPIRVRVTRFDDLWAGPWGARGYMAYSFSGRLEVDHASAVQIEFRLRTPGGAYFDGTLYQKELTDPSSRYNRDPDKDLRKWRYIDNPKKFEPGVFDPFRLAFLVEPPPVGAVLPHRDLALELRLATGTKKLIGVHHLPDFPAPPAPPRVTPDLLEILKKGLHA